MDRDQVLERLAAVVANHAATVGEKEAAKRAIKAIRVTPRKSVLLWHLLPRVRTAANTLCGHRGACDKVTDFRFVENWDKKDRVICPMCLVRAREGTRRIKQRKAKSERIVKA